MSVRLKRYRVKPGETVRLGDWDPKDTAGFKGKGKDDADEEAKELTKALGSLQEMLFAEGKHSLLIVLQGMDTSGKDGVIRRVFEGVNPAGVRVAHFREPSQEEIAHGFLWRVYKQAPARGEIVIFNRSHYEGVLVERVHKLVSRDECVRRYEEINLFERILSDEDTSILKFYLNIDEQEQTKRLAERLDDPTKEWKLSMEDIHERKSWTEYVTSYEEAIEATSTKRAPWYIVPSTHKWFRDLVVGSAVVKALGGMNMRYPSLPTDVRKAAEDLLKSSED
jgi:PPK2 family polyphosphate:nucleotide phosphotransferase